MAGTSPVLGLLMLDMQFPRPPGDVGNPETFDYPVIYRKVSGANAGSVVFEDRLPDEVLERFISEARALETQGASIIATSCGFLAPYQSELANAVNVPMITSSLWLLPHLRIIYGPEAELGILTFDSRKLESRHIPDSGPVHVGGFENGHELYRVISNDLTELDTAKAKADAVDAATALMQRHPAIKALLLECTNLPPYRDAISGAAGVPVHDICDLLNWHLSHL